MSQTVQNSVSFDNPMTLSTLSALCIVREIKHFTNEKTISGREFYLWKDQVFLSDWELEQTFQATLDHFGELDPKWLTLFLGSRRRALQLINVLVSPPLRGSIINDEAYSHQIAQNFLSIGTPRMRYVLNALHEAQMTNPTQSSSSLFSGLVKLFKKIHCLVSFSESGPSKHVAQKDTVLSDFQSTEDSVSVGDFSISTSPIRRTLCPAVITDCLNETNAGAQRQTLDCTGVLRRLVLRHNVSMPEAELLVGLLACAEPLEITIEDCSKLDSKFEVLELIAAHCPRLRTLKLYRCGNLLSQCFNRIADSPLSAPGMAQFASGLNLFYLRVLALHDLPAAATSSHSCDLLLQFAERLSTHLLELDLSGADFTACVTFEWLSSLRHLRVLLLADCKLPSDRSLIIGAICELHALIRLDMQHLRGETYIDTPPIRVQV